jgi:molybdate transport system substrate-binding protein
MKALALLASATKVVAVIAVSGAGLAAEAESPRLRVLAASSLTEAFPRIDARPAYGFAGSNQLAFQIRQGAPVDVFASASPTYTQALYRDELVERPVRFASNSLVLVVPRENPAGVRSVSDLRRKGIRIVIGNPQVPIGSYTRAVLRRLGLTRAVLANVVSQEPHVKGIVTKVALGQADAGFVYGTDARAAGRRLVKIGLPARAQPAVRYEVAVVAGSGHEGEARAWIRTLREPRAQRILRETGFGA